MLATIERCCHIFVFHIVITCDDFQNAIYIFCNAETKMYEENWKQTFNLHIIEYRYANESIVIKVITGRPLVSIWSWLDLVRSRLVRDCGFVDDKTYFIVRRLVGWIDNEFFLIYNIYKNIFLCFLEIVFYVFFNKKRHALGPVRDYSLSEQN